MAERTSCGGFTLGVSVQERFTDEPARTRRFCHSGSPWANRSCRDRLHFPVPCGAPLSLCLKLMIGVFRQKNIPEALEWMRFWERSVPPVHEHDGSICHSKQQFVVFQSRCPEVGAVPLLLVAFHPGRSSASTRPGVPGRTVPFISCLDITRGMSRREKHNVLVFGAVLFSAEQIIYH